MPVARRRPAALLAVGLTALAGCGGAGSDKAGGARASAKPVVLTLANANQSPDEVQPFADAVARLSHGALRIRFRNGLAVPRPDYEQRLIADVRGGRADLGWVGTRAWSTAGVRRFDALHAPFVIDDYALEERVLTSPLVPRMLDGLHAIGLEGIGVLPGPMRRLLGAGRPLAAPADFRGRTVGMQASDVAAGTLRALGARPVALPMGARIAGIGGVEQQLASMVGNHYWDSARFLTGNVALWPRPVVLFASPRAMARLTPGQRDLLRRAARAAVPGAVARVRAADTAALPVLCDHGVRYVTASPAAVAALHSAVAPVIAGLERDAFTRTAITQIEAMRRTVPVSATPAPTRCAPRARPTASPLPDGTYSLTLTRDDGHRAHLAPQDSFFASGTKAWHFRLTIDRGSVEIVEHPDDGPTDIGYEGRYTVYRDRVRIAATDGLSFTARWTFRHGLLRFIDIDGERGDAFVWGTRPWRRVAG